MKAMPMFSIALWRNIKWAERGSVLKKLYARTCMPLGYFGARAIWFLDEW